MSQVKSKKLGTTLSKKEFLATYIDIETSDSESEEVESTRSKTVKKSSLKSRLNKKSSSQLKAATISQKKVDPKKANLLLRRQFTESMFVSLNYDLRDEFEEWFLKKTYDKIGLEEFKSFVEPRLDQMNGRIIFNLLSNFIRYETQGPNRGSILAYCTSLLMSDVTDKK